MSQGAGGADCAEGQFLLPAEDTVVGAVDLADASPQHREALSIAQASSLLHTSALTFSDLSWLLPGICSFLIVAPS